MAENIYYVGGDAPCKSLTEMFLSLKDDFSRKTIYVNQGTYDIYREYREAGMATPPDDITAADYLERCVFLPPNTSLIGVGEVVLEWAPPKGEITKGEARTWSPLNIRYACHVENITIHCKYGRYCIHDDSHNGETDRGVTHRYRNVRCIYDYSEDGMGFNNTIGFGFSQKNQILFENCELVMRGCPADSPDHSAFYGHGASGRAVLAEESPTITVKNCRLLGGEKNGRTIRLQCLNRVPLHIVTLFENCTVEGGVYLTLYREDALQAFDVTLRSCGAPPVRIDRPEENPYPVKLLPGSSE